MATLGVAFQFEKTHRNFLQQNSKRKNMIRPKFMHAICIWTFRWIALS